MVIVVKVTDLLGVWVNEPECDGGVMGVCGLEPY